MDVAPFLIFSSDIDRLSFSRGLCNAADNTQRFAAAAAPEASVRVFLSKVAGSAYDAIRSAVCCAAGQHHTRAPGGGRGHRTSYHRIQAKPVVHAPSIAKTKNTGTGGEQRPEVNHRSPPPVRPRCCFRVT